MALVNQHYVVMQRLLNLHNVCLGDHVATVKSIYIDTIHVIYVIHAIYHLCIP